MAYLFLNVNSATDADLKRLYKKLVVKVHPDKGGTADDFRNLKEAYDKWTHPPQRGRPPPPPTDDNAGSNGLVSANAENCYELRNKAAMLTYQGVQDLARWDRMAQWLQHSVTCRPPTTSHHSNPVAAAVAKRPGPELSTQLVA